MMDSKNKLLTCLVTLPDSIVFAVDVDRNSEGRDVLNKVCENLHILETDYFGLLHYGSKGEELWLNLRNPLSAELTGSQPYRLHLQVKFFIEPHFIQQEATRNQFFLNAKRQFLDGKLKSLGENEITDLAALLYVIRQKESQRSFVPDSESVDSEYFLPAGYQCVQYQNLVAIQCQKLGTMSEQMARNRFLSLASSSPFFGMHIHEAKEDCGKFVYVGVCRDGIMEHNSDWKLLRSWAWSAVTSATHNAFDVILNTMQDDGLATSHSFKLTSKLAASSLYRDMTETHSFYQCDTIGSLVTEQYCRDLKGTIASFFNENTCLGKRYVFDIQRTLREAYDSARRTLYLAEMRSCSTSTVENSPHPSFLISESHHSCSSTCQAAKQLNDIRDSLLCHICVGADIDTAFVPCGHVVCCTACAQQLDCCPVCKHAIELAQSIYLPYVQPIFSASTADKLAVACT